MAIDFPASPVLNDLYTVGALGQRPYSEVSALIAKVYKIGQEAVNVEEASV